MMRRPCFSRRRIVSSLMPKPNFVSLLSKLPLFPVSRCQEALARCATPTSTRALPREQPLTAPTTYQVSDQMRDRPRTRTSVEIALTNPE